MLSFMIASGAGDVKAGTVFTFSSAFPLVTAQSPLMKEGFAGLTRRGQGKLMSRFLFQWIHQNGR